MFKLFKSKQQNDHATADNSSVSARATDLVLFYFPLCPFCKVVLRKLESLNLQVELRNIHEQEVWLQQLLTGGGKKTVPCLLIEQHSDNPRWLYESMDIVGFLNTNYGQ